jgi:hypothetical protein
MLCYNSQTLFEIRKYTYERSIKMKEVCSICGLPNLKIPNFGVVETDALSRCYFCQMFQHKNDGYYLDYEKNYDDFRMMISKAQRRPQTKYDGIVLFTGGKDSTYTLCKLVNEYKLRILALTWDNGFMNKHIKQNIEGVVKKLNVDHVYIKLSDHTLRSIYSNRLRLYGRICSCGPLAILLAAPQILKEKPSYVFYSSSATQLIAQCECHVNKEEAVNRNVRKLDYWIKNSGKATFAQTAEQIKYPLFSDLCVGDFDQEAIDELGIYFDALQKIEKSKDQFFIYPSYYLQWNESEMYEEIKKNGWISMDPNITIGHTSCTMESVKGYLANRMGVVDFDLLELCTARRIGKIDNENYRNEIEKLNYSENRPPEYDELLKWLGISEQAEANIFATINAPKNFEALLNAQACERFHVECSNEKLAEKIVKTLKTSIMI